MCVLNCFLNHFYILNAENNNEDGLYNKTENKKMTEHIVF